MTNEEREQQKAAEQGLNFAARISFEMAAPQRRFRRTRAEAEHEADQLVAKWCTANDGEVHGRPEDTQKVEIAIEELRGGKWITDESSRRPGIHDAKR